MKLCLSQYMEGHFAWVAESTSLCKISKWQLKDILTMTWQYERAILHFLISANGWRWRHFHLKYHFCSSPSICHSPRALEAISPYIIPTIIIIHYAVQLKHNQLVMWTNCALYFWFNLWIFHTIYKFQSIESSHRVSSALSRSASSKSKLYLTVITSKHTGFQCNKIWFILWAPSPQLYIWCSQLFQCT